MVDFPATESRQRPDEDRTLMDLDGVRQTVARGESESLELKKTTGDLKAGMQSLCAMLNGTGGRVIFGVTPGGKIAGQDITDTTLQEVAREIRRLEPSADVEQIRLPVSGGREILILQTTTAPEAPYTYDGRPYKRIGPTTSPMPRSEYHQRLLAQSHALHRWENQVAEGYSLSDLDTDEINHSVQAAIHCGRLRSQPFSPEDSLDRFQLRVHGQLLRAAVVLFGRKFMPYYPQCTVRLARFKGIDKSEFLDHRQLHGHAFEILDESMHFILRNIPIAGRFEPGKLERQDIPLYPPLALREALVNAICHRDYTIAGGAIYVAIFDDRLEVISAGLLPPGITVAELKRDHQSKLRNPLIAGVFYRSGLIEQWGRGTQRIVDWCVAAGQPEPEFEERVGDVVVRFRPSGYHPPLRVSHDLSDRQRQILAILSDRRSWKVHDILSRLENPPGLRMLQLDLRMLREFRLVQTKGRGGNARWWLVSEGE
jgi:ATP-dependent DNA helicase RecG